MPADLIGHTFGSYKLVAQLGRGGMATVYRGYQEAIDRSVAVKVLPHEYMHDPNFSERFVTEARMLAKLVHPSIMPLYDFGTAEVPYIIMPLMAHGTLADRLARGPLPAQEILRIGWPIASALDYAHKQGVVHRDLKPSNILFDQNDTPFLGDFGIAKALETNSGLTGTGIIGTPDYMSPEQAQGEKIDSRSDIYALGVVIYQLLTGQQLFKATTPMGIVLKHMTEMPPLVRLTRPDLSETVDSVLQKALAKRPDDRYQTASEFINALGSALGQPVTAATRLPATSDMGTIIKPGLSTAQARPATPGTPLARPATGQMPTSGTAVPPYAAPPRRGGLGGLLIGGGVGVVIGVGLIILLIGACCVGLYAFYVANVTPTPTVAVVQPATQTRVATPSGVLLSDDFSNSNSGWEISSDASAVIGYVGGEYSIKEMETGWFAWGNPTRAAYSNIRLDVEATTVPRGSDVLFGVICDFVDNQHYYYAGVDATGNYAIGKHDGETDSYLSNGGQIQNSPKMARGGNYKLGLECGHGVIALYVDGVLIDAVNDTTFTQGNVGLFLDTFDPPGGQTHQPTDTEVRYDNLAVSALPETPPTPRPATPTPVAAAQVSATPRAAARGTPVGTPVATGENWIVDPFDSNQYKWVAGVDKGEYATIDRTIADGKYRWSVTASKGFVAPKNPSSFAMTDFVAAVEVQQTGGDPGRAGLTFRLDNDTNYYYFSISSSDQKYGVFLYYQGKWQTLVALTQSDAIFTDQANWISVRGTGSHFVFYINNRLVNEVDDTQLSQPGWMGLAAEMEDGKLGDFEFDNFRLGPPEMLLFLDDFSKDTAGWGVDSDADVKRSFTNGQYHITVSKTSTVGWSTLDKEYQDFDVEVETTGIGGPDNNDHGLLLRYVDADNFYRFAISGTGAYTFDKLKNNAWTTLVDWTNSPAIISGHATNRLRVICQGGTFTFFVNDVRVGDFQDTEFATGKVGLIVGTYKDAGAVHVSFDNLRVWAVK